MPLSKENQRNGAKDNVALVPTHMRIKIGTMTYHVKCPAHIHYTMNEKSHLANALGGFSTSIYEVDSLSFLRCMRRDLNCFSTSFHKEYSLSLPIHPLFSK